MVVFFRIVVLKLHRLKLLLYEKEETNFCTTYYIFSDKKKNS